MAVVRRDDGIQFVVQSYRELLTQKNPALLKNEIRYIGKTNGDFARLFKQREGQYEAVFSRDPGYLLGETVWYHFGKPADLIYCEALPDEMHALVVIVRSGSVYLDAKLPLAGIQDEFISLVAGSNRFVIYIYGDIPLAQQPEEGKFAFEPQHVQSFNVLTEPLFPKLPLNENLRLLAVEQAIKVQNLDKGLSPALIVAGLFVLGVLGYWLFSDSTVHAPQPAVSAPVQQQTSPREVIINRLRGPTPEQQLQKITSTLGMLFNLPGWIVNSIDYSGGDIYTKLSSIGGGATALLDWAEKNGGRAELSSEGATMRFPVNLPGRSVQPPVMKEDAVTAAVIDKMLQTLPGRSVQINKPVSSGGVVEERLTVSFTNISPTTLALIGKQVDGLPVKLEKCSVNLTDGLLSGQLELVVIGE